METLDLITAILGVPLVAGALGGGIRWSYLQENLRQGLRSVLTGSLVGHFFWVLAGNWVDGLAAASQVDASAARGAGAFAIGMVAIQVIGWVFDRARRATELKKEEP